MRKNAVFKRILLSAAAVVTIILFFVAIPVVIAGVVKTGGGYEISDDAFNAAGSANLSGGTYRLLHSVGQTVGTESLTGTGTSVEGGFISGIESVFQVSNSIISVESPAGFTGAPGSIVPGARLTFKFDFSNQGEATESGTALIDDPVPTALSYASGTIILTLNNASTPQTDTLDGDSCSYTASDSIHCLIQNIDAGATGTLIFKAIVK
ncbi:MAG TPA: hypothetical protein PLQ76_00020 [bacterium]|nr:hypothetical protein [bacterium]